MSEDLVTLIQYWELGPVAVTGWSVAVILGLILRSMYKVQRENARETREWLKEDSAAKVEYATGQEKVVGSLQSMARSLELLNQRLEKLERMQAVEAARRRDS